MKRALLIAPFLAACATTPEPLCDRERVVYDKLGRVLETCPPPKRPIRMEIPHGQATEPDTETPVGSPPRDPERDPDGDDDGPDLGGPDGPEPDPDHPATPGAVGNPGNHKDVGKAGENPNGKGGWGEGDKGRSR